MIHLRLDRRALGAIEFVDATTGAPIRRPLHVQSEGRLYRQRSGLLVIRDAPGLHEHTLAFERAPELPAVGSVPLRVRVVDPAREYLATTVEIALPRDPDPAAPNSVLKPQAVRLWRSGAAPVSPNWTVFQATVLRAATETPLPGALLTLQAAGQTVQALSDETGQAVLALVGQPLFTLGGGGTLTRSLPAVVAVRLSAPGDTPLDDVEAEIARLAARPVHTSFNRTLPTGASTQEVLEIAL